MKTRKTIEGNYEQGQVVEIESRKIESDKVIKTVEKMVVLDVIATEEVYRCGKGLVVKSDCWLGTIDGNLPVEFAHFCVVATEEIRDAGRGLWWGKKSA